MDTENLKLTQKVGRSKKYFTEQEAQEMAKNQRAEAKKRQSSVTNPVGSKDPYILSLLTVLFNPCISASASYAETLLSIYHIFLNSEKFVELLLYLRDQHKLERISFIANCQIDYLQYVSLVDGQDLYDGQNEKGANYLVNLSSAIKQIDLEVWFYQTNHDNESLEVDLPIFSLYIGNFLEYPQMLIICVSNKIQGITLQSTGGNGFSNVCFKQKLVDAPVLWGQNMMSQQCLVGQNKLLVFTLCDNLGRKILMQYMDMSNNILLQIQFQ
ncbi:MAG: hypothetical protein EZS28_020668 [Streblomastix strix]|uniref:Uncharacterized protein n=1 Tax=Streblomastix strix TaxID=222440 RepID=A0A5J4VMY9_9EUKA|nr:MAG: hypothetical protein EZS28_020668 [Streblomastix strix]